MAPGLLPGLVPTPVKSDGGGAGGLLCVPRRG